MGTWSSSIFGNDLALDVKDNFLYLLRRGTYSEETFLKEFNDVICSPEWQDSQDYADFWLSLAAMQWDYGVLTEYTRQKAIECLSIKNNRAWIDLKTSRLDRKREKVLSDFGRKIASPNLSPKKVRKLKSGFISPLNINGIYALPATNPNGFPFFIIFQVVNYCVFDTDDRYDNRFPVIKLFSKTYNKIPDLKQLKEDYPLPAFYSFSKIKEMGDNGVNENGKCFIRYAITLIDLSRKEYDKIIPICTSDLLFPTSIDEDGGYFMLFIKELNDYFFMMKEGWDNESVKWALNVLRYFGV